MTKIKFFHELMIEWSIKYASDKKNRLKSCIYDNTIEKFMSHIGLLPMCDINKDKVLDLLDLIENVTYKDGYYIAKKDIKYILYSYKLTYSYIRKTLKYSSSQLTNIFKGEKITMKSAKKFSELINVPIYVLFDDYTSDYKYSSSSKLIYRKMIKRVLRYGYEQGYLNEDFSETKPRAKNTTLICYKSVSKKQFQSFLSKLFLEENIKIKTLMLTALECKLDSDFITSIKWDDIDFKENRINLTSKKSKKFPFVNTDIKISSILSTQLKEYRKWQREYYPCKSDYVFQTIHSPRMRPEYVGKEFFNFKNKIKQFDLSLTSIRNYIEEHGFKDYEDAIHEYKIHYYTTFQNQKDIKNKMKILGFESIYEYFDYLDYLDALNNKHENEFGKE